MKIQKYSDKWIKYATDDELRVGREELRKGLLNARNNDSEVILLQIWINKIDSELSKRAWGGSMPQPPSYSREHGRNLYKKE